jgi:hypothetical protein
MPPQASCPLLNMGTGGMRSVGISFCILVARMARVNVIRAVSWFRLGFFGSTRRPGRRPKQYLQRALECARLSQRVADDRTRDTLAAMAKTWVKLADADQGPQRLVEQLEDRIRKRKAA